MLKNKVWILSVLFALGVACGTPGTPPGASPDAPVSNTPGDDDNTDSGGAQRVEPRAGLINVRPTVWDRYKERPGNAVDLYFWSGIEECYGVDHIEVDYKEKVVTVTIYEGGVPDAETCIELAVRKVVRVDLDEPLSDRSLVDGGPKA